MKKAARSILAVLALTGITGCVVNSVYPFYLESDLIFHPGLVGVWRAPGNPDEANTGSWTFERVGLKDYKLTVHDGEQPVSHEAHLFALDGQAFLDLLPLERKDGFIPAHQLVKVTQIDPTLQLGRLKYEWLRELLEENPGAIRHQKVYSDPNNKNNYELVLTADTAELQAFLRQCLHSPEAFAQPVAMERQEVGRDLGAPPTPPASAPAPLL